MTLNIHLPGKMQNLRPVITVVGVGGAGGNAVNNMIASNLEGVNFVVANTDAQALEHSLCDKRVQLGAATTQGLGAGAAPDVGRISAEESMDELEGCVLGSNMLFITAGMGGGTGTGAAPVIAKLAKDNGILTVGVVTKPFHFEGHHRMRLADSGIAELQKYVDTLIVIPNQNLFRIANERTTFADAFKMADDVLHAGVRGITDLMIMPGLINLDFADIRTVMSEMGKAMMGTGEAEGDRRSIDAAEAAISNPLLDEISMKGARGVLINITGGPDLTLFEVDEAANRIREEVDPDANIIFGSTFNKDMTGKLRVSVVATGIESQKFKEQMAAANMKAMNNAANNTASPEKRGIGIFSSTAPKQPSAAQTAATASVASSMNGDMNAQTQPVNQPQGQAATQSVAASGQKVQLSIEDPSFTNAKAESQFSMNSALDSSGMEARNSQPQPRKEERANAPLRPERPVPNQSQQGNSAMSFFQKIGLTKPVSPQKSEGKARDPRISQTGDTAVKMRPSDEDYLEVPAFLRRQSNQD